MPAETGAGGALLLKSGLLIGIVSALAAGLGFAIAWPENAKEAFYRFSAAFIGSIVLGIPLSLVAWHYLPWMFHDAITISQAFFAAHPALHVSEFGAAFVGVLFAAIPFLFAGALPFWWLSRAVVLYLERRKNKDIMEMAQEGVRAYKRFRP